MAAIATRQTSHHLRAEPSTRAPVNPPMDSKKSSVKNEDKSTKGSPSVSSADIKKSSQPSASTTSSKPTDTNNADKPSTNADSAAPLAPPPKPAQSGNEGGDYFSGNHQGNNQSYNSEQNLFESAFAKLPETPGGTQLPPVASLTSPAGQLTGNSAGTFNWGNGSLRSGPLSPAMLSGPATGEDYFSTSAIRGGFPTPNESSLRTGLTPGGGGSMFPPAPSPNTQALFNQLGSGFATPGTLDFHRTAMNANKKAESFTSAAPAPTTTTAAADSSAQVTANQQNFDQHDAANGLFMLAQAGTESANNTYAQSQQDTKRAAARPNNGSVSNISDVTQGRDSAPSEEADQKPNTRNKGKKATAKNARKAEDTPSKQPPKKKGKANNGIAANLNQFEEEPDSEEEIKEEEGDGIGKDGKKMTDEEKRKNFLERNRVAALKCRQRKKQWLANLQAKVEIFSSENDALSAQVAQLREEILNLKTILIAHKDCPIAQQQAAVGQYIPTHGPDYGAHANPYGNFQQPGQVPMGAGGPRRYS